MAPSLRECSLFSGRELYSLGDSLDGFRDVGRGGGGIGVVGGLVGSVEFGLVGGCAGVGS